MIDASLSLEAAEGLKGADLLPYLAAKGWTVKPSRIDGISILSRELPGAEKPAEFILPVKPGFADEHRRVADALRTLSQIEGQPESVVAENVRRAAARPISLPEIEVPPEATTIAYEDPSRPLAWAKFLSDVEIENSAQQLRQSLRIADEPSFNVVSLLENEVPRVITGFRFLVMEASQAEKSVEAYSRIFPPSIFVRSDIRNLAAQGEPRSRFTIAHELAHLWLGTELRATRRRGSPQQARIRLRAEEEEASKFAAAFLMPMHLVQQIHDPVRLSIQCKVSVEAAKFRMTLVYHLRYPTETARSERPYRLIRRGPYGLIRRIISYAVRRLG